MNATACKPLLLLPLVGLLTSCSRGWACANTEEARVTSPDSVWDGVAFTRDCGATTDYSSQVALVRRSRSLPDRPGNVFVYGHHTDIRLKWLARDSLNITYSSANPVRQEHLVESIAIVYGKLP